ncbi:MAG: hypothetical protein HY332_05930 [Chloroflexi bacterium]|nr:hypothetical protein [Chloroflexota bacterium]
MAAMVETEPLGAAREPSHGGRRDEHDLNGAWSFGLDPERTGQARGWPESLRAQTIQVPGSWQEQGYGVPDPLDELRWPTWRHQYHGMAWYARSIEVPASWAGSRLVLELERVNWLTHCWVNGRFAGEGESIATPQRFDLTDYLRPGEFNQLTLSVDNWRPDLGSYNEWQRSFAFAGNPGGLLGPARLLRLPPLHVVRAAIAPDLAAGLAHCRLTLAGALERAGAARVTCRVRPWAAAADGRADGRATVAARRETDGTWVAAVPVPAPVRRWSPADPFLYVLQVEITGDGGEPLDRFEQRFGMREIRADGRALLLNGTPVFLRFDVDFMMFPDRGYPPFEKDVYIRRFRKYQEYGFNGARCHSGTPPRAYFAAADETGFLVQCELPNWSNMLREAYVAKAGPFLEREWRRIIEELQPHPSLIIHCLGNELLSADAEGRYGVHSPWINARIEEGRALDPTRLYADNSGFIRVPPEPECVSDLLIPGLVTGATPDTRTTFAHYLRGADRPVILHEHTLTPAYPNLENEPLYTGNMVPTALRRTREALAARGMLEQWPEFLRAAGHLQVVFMKELFEKARRTPGVSGWHMNSFVDNDGRSWATTGYVDGFLRDKGFTTPDAVRAFAGDTALLLAAPTKTYYAGESLWAEVLVSHFGESGDDEGVPVQWSLAAPGGDIASGALPPRRLPAGRVTVVGAVEVVLPHWDEPAKITLSAWAEVQGQRVRNCWDFWVFPRALVRGTQGRVSATRRLPTVVAQYPEFPPYDVRERRVSERDPWRTFDGLVAITDGLVVPQDVDFLLNGGTLIALAGADHVWEAIPSRFMPPWCAWIFFPTAEFQVTGAIVRRHPLMDRFPHDGCIDWQFYGLVEGGAIACLDALPPDLVPIVQAVDAPQRSKRLAYLFEARVGRGKLIFTTFRLAEGLFDASKRRQIGAPGLQVDPAAWYLLDQTIRYALSNACAPAASLLPAHLLSLCRRPSSERSFYWRCPA